MSNRPPWLDDSVPEKAPRAARKPRKADPIGTETRATVRRRSGGTCECCALSPATHVHHRQLRRCGDHSAPNLLDLCSTCHTRLHNRVRYALDTGMIVSAYDDPAMREVLYRGRDWVYLGANGELLNVPSTGALRAP
jgi:hypothetical protein